MGDMAQAASHYIQLIDALLYKNLNPALVAEQRLRRKHLPRILFFWQKKIEFIKKRRDGGFEYQETRMRFLKAYVSPHRAGQLQPMA